MLLSIGFLMAVKRSLSECIKRQSGLVLVLFLLQTLSTAEDPWERKSAAEWDKADVHRILYDSPWVKHVTRTKRDLEFELPDPGPTGMELRGYHAKDSKDDGALTTEFYVRWVSSRTMRRAMERRAALMKHSRPESADDQTPPMLDDLEIAIAGSDMSAFERVHAAKFKTKCYLLTTAKLKIRPTRVEFARSSEGKIHGILFHFPRTTQNGEPLISRHEARVWFFEAAAETQISVTFHPQTMVDEKGLDL